MSKMIGTDDAVDTEGKNSSIWAKTENKMLTETKTKALSGQKHQTTVDGDKKQLSFSGLRRETTVDGNRKHFSGLGWNF